MDQSQHIATSEGVSTMNIYFAGSIRGGRDLQSAYAAIVQHLQEAGHTVLTEAVASATIEVDERDLTDQMIYEQDMAWLNASDLVIAEVTVPSLGVGYEIGYALHTKCIPVLCLCHHDTHLSAMLTGNTDRNLTIHFYRDITGALPIITEFIAQHS